MFRILIVEDDRALSDGICLALQDKEHSLVQAENLKQAEQILFCENEIGGITEDTDLVILDLNLPDGNGLELLKKLRKYSQLPVIILTANDMEVDIVTGLESGADDYITKQPYGSKSQGECQTAEYCYRKTESVPCGFRTIPVFF